MKEIFYTYLPHSVLEQAFLHLKFWQWGGLLLVVVVGFVVSTVVAQGLNRVIHRIVFQKIHFAKEIEADKTQLDRPILLILMGWAMMLGMYKLAFPSQVYVLLLAVAKVSTYIGFVWAGMKFSDMVAFMLRQKALETQTKLDDLLAPLVGRSLKVFFALLGVVSVAELFNLPIASLLTGLGIGGIAIAMAAKDTIANVFGSLTVVMDQPFHIGDSVKINDVEGTVEKVGFRSTRIRTLYKSLVTIPNSELITATVDNLGARPCRRMTLTLGLTYDTPSEKIEAYCQGVRDLIMQHPHTLKETVEVRFVDFSASSLDILVYLFLDTTTWSEELAYKNELLLSFKALAERLGVEFAFPTQTLYLKGDTHV